MKLLLDQNLSRKIVKHIEEIYPNSTHIALVLSETSSDQDIRSRGRRKRFFERRESWNAKYADSISKPSTARLVKDFAKFITYCHWLNQTRVVAQSYLTLR